MVKHTQTIRWQIADELFDCVRHFVRLAFKGLTSCNSQHSQNRTSCILRKVDMIIQNSDFFQSYFSLLIIPSLLYSSHSNITVHHDFFLYSKRPRIKFSKLSLHKKWSFPLRIFTEEILNGKLHFLRSVFSADNSWVLIPQVVQALLVMMPIAPV